MRAAALVEHRPYLRGRERGAIAGDAFELVQCAAGMAERAPAEHGDAQARSGGDGRNQKGGLVADAAGRVLVHRGTRGAATGRAAQIELHAGGAHGLGERMIPQPAPYRAGMCP